MAPVERGLELIELLLCEGGAVAPPGRRRASAGLIAAAHTAAAGAGAVLLRLVAHRVQVRVDVMRVVDVVEGLGDGGGRGSHKRIRQRRMR